MIKKLSGSLRRRSATSGGSGVEDEARMSFTSSQASEASGGERNQKTRRPAGGLEDLAAAYRRVLADHNAARNEAKAIREARGAMDRKDAHRAPEFKHFSDMPTGQSGSTDYVQSTGHRGKDISPKYIRRSGRIYTDGSENDKPNLSASRGLKENVVVKMTGSRRSRRHRLYQETASRAKSMESPGSLTQDRLDRAGHHDSAAGTRDASIVSDPRGALRARSMVEPDLNHERDFSADIPFFADDRQSDTVDGVSNETSGVGMKVVEQRKHDNAHGGVGAPSSMVFDKRPRQPSVSNAKPPKKPVNPVAAVGSSVRRASGSKESAGLAVEPRTKTVPVMVVTASSSDDPLRRDRHPRQQSFAVGDNRVLLEEPATVAGGDRKSSIAAPHLEQPEGGGRRHSRPTNPTSTSPPSTSSSPPSPASPGYSDRSDPTNIALSRASSSRHSATASAMERLRPCRWSLEGVAPDNYGAISQRRDRAEAKGLISACSVLEREVLAIEHRAGEIVHNPDDAAFLEATATSLRRALAILEDRYDSIEDFYLKGREYAHAMGRFYQVSPEEYDRWTRGTRPRSRTSARSTASAHERPSAASPTIPTLHGVDSMTRMSLR